jgi:KaiC/GvpD/RAD55 family RecA-like ATPase
MTDAAARSDSPKPLTLILTDNEVDLAALRNAGYKSVRLVTSEESICRIVNGEAVVDPAIAEFFAKVILAVRDADLRDGLAVRIGDTKCRWVANFNGLADNPDAIRARIGDAKLMWLDEVCRIDDIPDSGPQRTYTSGFPLLDKHGFRFIRPAFMPVIGPYGSGKSVLVRQLACNLLRLHGWRCLITSFEEKVKPRYQRDLRAHLIGFEDYDNNGERGWTPRHPSLWTEADVAKADSMISEGFRFLRRKRSTVLDVDRLIYRIEYAVRVYGVEVVVVDPVNEIDHQLPKGVSKTDYMGNFMMQLKQLADDYQLLIILCAHPPKEGVARRGDKGRILTLNDAADTAHYGNKADIGWCVWRPSMDPHCPTYLNIDKLKDHDVMGAPTLAKLALDKGLGRFNVVKIGHVEVAAEILGETL